jgi:hypothetical protein
MIKMTIIYFLLFRYNYYRFVFTFSELVLSRVINRGQGKNYPCELNYFRKLKQNVMHEIFLIDLIMFH